MPRTHGLEELQHDHVELNRRVLELAGQLRGGRAELGQLRGTLVDLREHLFLHFAREEEGLFPYVARALPDLGDDLAGMAAAHDGICGTLARMAHLVQGADEAGHLDLLSDLFARFESSYSEHAQSERDLLQSLSGRLTAAQRTELAELLRGL
jgi:hypothetical protein